MKSKFSIVFFVAVSILALLGSAISARAQGTPTLKNSVFFGGADDQRGTAISVSNGAIYISGNVQPETGSASDTALILNYSVPPASTPTWSSAFGFGTDLYGIASTTEGVYVGGQNYSLTNDFVGDKEDKTLVSKFSLDGTSGLGPAGSVWTTGGPGNLGAFFSYSGGEVFQSLTPSLESGTNYVYAAGAGQPCSYDAYIVAKYDSLGNFVAAATDSSVGISFGSCSIPSAGFSDALGGALLNGNVYLAGYSDWAFEGGQFPAVWKYDSSLNLLWRVKDTTLNGSYSAITSLGGYLYAVGSSGSPLEYLIEKLDESGNLVWRTNTGGANAEALTGVVGIGTRLFAVGYTRNGGSGGADVVILEIDPATGNILSTTLWGGALDDFANGAATDGTDLFVVGESRSFASAAGNLVGSNDVVLLDYGLGINATTTALVSSLNPSTFNQSVTFTATVTSSGGGTPTGTVTFNDGPNVLGVVPLNGTGQAALTTSTLGAGSHSIVASYSGDSANQASTSTALRQTVQMASTTLGLASNINPSAYNQAVTFTASLTPQFGGSATGTVTFKDGANTLGTATVSGNLATITVNTLAVGTHSITAAYSGDSNFTGSSSGTVSQVVTKASTTTAVASSLNPAFINQTITYTATVTSQYLGTVSGSVLFKSGATSLGSATLVNGQASVNTSFSTPGNRSITATYVGDVNNTGSISPKLTQVVNKYPSSTTVASSLNPSSFGQMVTFTATVTTGGSPTGTVTFKSGTATLGTVALTGNTASLSTSALAAGTHIITAKYSGDATFQASTSLGLKQVVSKALTAESLTSSPNPSNLGQLVTFTATVSSSAGVPTGTVTFKKGTTTLGTAALSGGVATFTTSTLPAGSSTITANYGGTANYSPSSASLTQVVQ